MPTVLLPIVPGTLPLGVCYSSEQERLNAYAEVSSVELPGQAYYNFGDSVPAPENNGYPWLRSTDMRWYRFEGDWISPVGPEYDLNIRRLWVGSLPNLVTYDGGDAGAATDRSGPMWVEDTDFAGRSPMHPGAISGADPAKTLAVVENYGTGAHTNILAEMVEHAHAMKFDTAQTGEGYPTLVGNGANIALTFNTEKVGSVTPTPYSLVHPVRGIYLIKWTGRTYRKI